MLPTSSWRLTVTTTRCARNTTKEATHSIRQLITGQQIVLRGPEEDSPSLPLIRGDPRLGVNSTFFEQVDEQSRLHQSTPAAGSVISPSVIGATPLGHAPHPTAIESIQHCMLALDQCESMQRRVSVSANRSYFRLGRAWREFCQVRLGYFCMC